MKNSLALIIMFCFLSINHSAFGNGAAFNPGLNGVGAIPVKLKNVRMLEEIVKIDLRKNGIVECVFILQNLMNEQISFQMGFPFVDHYNQIEHYKSKPDFFNAYINEKSTDVRLSTSEQYSFVYLWDVVFEPNETKKITCKYKTVIQDMSSDLGLVFEKRTFNYITHTGALWAGNIAKATFLITFDEKLKKYGPDSYYADKNKRTNELGGVFQSNLRPSGYTWNPEKCMAEYVFYNWEPEGPESDIVFTFTGKALELEDYFRFKEYNGSTVHYTQNDLAMPEIYELEKIMGVECSDGIFYDGYGCDLNVIKAKSEKLNELYQKYIRLMRNEIFARLGHDFTEEYLKSVFNLAPWYTNKNIKVDQLNEIEKENTTLLLNVEKSNSYCLKREPVLGIDSSIIENFKKKNPIIKMWLDARKHSDSSCTIKNPIRDNSYRKTYCDFLSRTEIRALVKLSGKNLFISGPHKGVELNLLSSDDFGHYNKEFVTWVKDNVIPKDDLDILWRLTKTIYNKNASRVRKLYITYLALQSDDQYKKNRIKIYKAEIKRAKEIERPWISTDNHGSYEFVLKIFPEEILKKYMINRYSEYGCALSFWLRRSMDGTEKEFSDLIEKIVKLYDKNFSNEIDSFINET